MKKKILVLLASLAILVSCIVPVFAQPYDEDILLFEDITEFQPADDYAYDSAGIVEKHYMVDNAGLLDSTERETLELTLQEISDELDFDVAVVTVDSLEGKTPEEYADDYFDYNGYGRGEEKSGCLLLVSMADRDWHITTTGYGTTALTDYGIEYISQCFLPYLSRGDYSAAFTTFGNSVEEFVVQANEGEPYDIHNEYSAPRRFSPAFILFGVITGVIAASIVVSIFKGKMNNVSPKTEATAYLVEGSFSVINQRDDYLRNKIITTPIATSSDSGRGGGGGGSSIHVSSSGMSHGGGGGKF